MKCLNAFLKMKFITYFFSLAIYTINNTKNTTMAEEQQQKNTATKKEEKQKAEGTVVCPKMVFVCVCRLCRI